jgi:hypothetical protein
VKAFVAAAGLTMVGGPIVGIALICGMGSEVGAAAAVVAACRTSGPLNGLTDVQARNARTIVTATQQLMISDAESPASQERAELIAVMTAETESTLHNYANPRVPASEDLPSDGNPPSGGDHDSVGLFQQRANWGPLATRMTPEPSTRLFVTHMLTIPAWQTQPPGIVAQAVQGSAFPDRYAKNQALARSIVVQIESSPQSLQCGSDGLNLPGRGSIPPAAIPHGYSIPASATDAERKAVTFALAQLGKPYVFGAVGPNTYDCSGLTMAAWAAAGVQLPHYTVSQFHMGSPVPSTSLLSPGDLIFIPGSDGTLRPPNPHHVGMYIGRGYVIEAPQTGDVVKIVPLDEFSPVVGIRHLE